MKQYKFIWAIYYAVLVLAINILIPKIASAITVAEEEELSQEFMKVVSKRYDLIKDPIIINYVENIGKRILAVMPPQPFPYHFYVVRQDVYNAFAGPAGHIFINSGLFEAMENEEELAGILSHEISHAVCRHISQQVDRSTKLTIGTLAGIVAGILLGAGGAGAAAINAATIGSVAAGQSIALAYSRDDEMQADQIGLKYLIDAGYKGNGLLSMLRKIRSKQWFGPDQIPTYLNTHPGLEERLAYIGGFLEGRTGGQTTEVSEFIKAHNRLIALYGNEQATLRIFEEGIRKFPDDPLQHYGYGLILGRTGNRKNALIHLRAALEKKAFDTDILSDLGRIYFLDGKFSDAIKVLEGAVGISPYHPEGLFYLGRTQMGLEKFAAAGTTFETLIEKYPDYDEAYYFAGEAIGKEGRMADAHYYLGIYYKSKGDFKTAIFHLKHALEGITDPAKQGVIQDMLKDIRKDEFKESKERKGE